MDTKSTKNSAPTETGKFRAYNPPVAVNKVRLKTLLIVLCASLILVIYMCVFKLIDYSEATRIINDPERYEQLKAEELRSDPIVANEIDRYARNLNRFYIFHKDFKSTPDYARIPDSAILDAIAEEQENRYAAGHDIIDKYYSIFMDMDLSNSRDDGMEGELAPFDGEALALALDDFQNEILAAAYDILFVYPTIEEEIWNQAIEELKENFYDIEEYLRNAREFRYYLVDYNAGRSYNNLDGYNLDEYLENQAYFYVPLSDITALFNSVPMNESFSEAQIEGYIIVPKDQPLTGVVAEALENFEASQELIGENAVFFMKKYALILLISILLTFILIRVIIAMCDNYELEVFGLDFLKKLPLIAKVAALGFSAFLLFAYLRDPMELFVNGWQDIGPSIIRTLFLGCLATAFLFCLRYTLYLLRDVKRFKDEPEIQSIRKLSYDFSIMRKFSPYMFPILCFVIIGGIGIMTICSILIITNNYYFSYFFNTFGILPTFLFLVVAVFALMALKIIINYAKLGVYIDHIAQGNYSVVPTEKGLFVKPINKLNDLSQGLQDSLDEMLKSERTKSELITNVSHDLKTPLTSIINYVELLSKCGLPGPTEQEYVEILRQKSQRLKLLIEDLFEAAKLSGSAIELTFNRVDVVQLLAQTMGELSEKMERSNLEFRFTANPEHIFILLDGQKMWRVFENLLNNILKYSKEGTRVYISVLGDKDTAEITMKNISAYELDFDGNELFERFKRGDQSRSTEGSGLGLSIARGIVELHGGKMDIAIDGDLFKITILLNINIAQG